MDLDLSGILAQSRATTARLSSAVTKSAADSIPRLERALPQIDRDSRRLAPAPSHDPSAALRLLSAHGVDTQRIERGISYASRVLADTAAAAAHRIPHADLDAHLAADHETAVVDAISAALARTQQKSMAAVASARDAEWKAAKRDLISLPALTGRDSRSRAEVARPASSTAPGGIFASPFRTPAGANLSPLTRGAASTTPGDSRRRPSSASVYEGIVRRVVHARASPTAAVAVATEMDDALVGSVSRGDVSLASKQVQHLHAVFTALRYMAGEAAAEGIPPAEGALGGLFAGEDRRRVTLGAVRYLALQFREEKMRREVEARPRDAARGGVPGIVGDVRAYLNLSFDRGVPPQLASGPGVAGLPLWPQMYFCLRAGDPNAALGIINEVLTEGATTSSSVVLFRQCLEAYIESGERRALPEDLLSRLVHDYGMSVYRGVDNYQRVCYVVLSRLDPAAGEKMALTDEDYSLLFFSIEDYLWLRLSIARLDGDPAPPGPLAAYGLSLRDVQREIVEFGPAHFDERGDSPVFYALILLLCGDFAGAINYLAGGPRAVLEATHIAFVLYHYGMIRIPERVAVATALLGRGNGFTDLKTPPPISSPTDVGERDCLTVRYDELLWQYICQFLADDQPAAAVYLFTLRDVSLRNDYLKKLILETRAFKILLGDGPVNAPSRRRGVLEELWPLGGTAAAVDGNDWASTVSSAASEAERRGDRAAAATLHDLTGATDKVAEIVMGKLSAELTSRGAPARNRALSEARTYQERLALRRSHGMASGSSLTLRSLDAVVCLAEFFDALWANSSADVSRAWSIVRSIGILPETDSVIGMKVREASVPGVAWAAAVCDRVPDVVVGAMECLARLHGSRRGASDAAPVRDAAHVLMNFAGLLPNATADMSARLIRLEVLMS